MISNAFIGAFDNWYGLLLATGITLSVVGAYFTARHRGMEGDVIIDMIIICLPLAIIGARVYHVVFDMLAGNSWTFAEFCGFSDGKFKGLAGLAIYGGLIGAIIGAGLFHLLKNRNKVPKNKRVSFFQIADVGFVFVLLGQVIGRWGNFANGEAYGEIIENTALQWSPFGMYVKGEWRYSIWFYESLWNLIGFGILLYLYLGKRKSFDGFVFAMYCIYYGMGRIWIEAIRVNDVLMLGGARVSVLVSVFFVIAGVAIIVTHCVMARRAGKKIFIFAERKKLGSSYYGYEKTKIAHPMPDIVFFKDRKNKKKGDDIIVDKSGLAIRVVDEPAAGGDSLDSESDHPEDAITRKTKNTVAEDDGYEDKWD